MSLLSPRLQLKVAQKQILTPGLVQMVTVLQLNRLELKDMITQEIVKNPVLEEAGEDPAEEVTPEELLPLLEAEHKVPRYPCRFLDEINTPERLRARLDRLLVTDPAALDSHCNCVCCRNYSRAYLHHLFLADEMLGPTLLSLHNVAFYCGLMAKARAAIEAGTFAAFHQECKARWGGNNDE